MKAFLSKRLILLLTCSSVFLAGPVAVGAASSPSTETASQSPAAEPLQGKILGVSKKAKTISIEAGGKPVLVKFNEKTEGMEFAKVDDGAIIRYTTVGKDRIATVVKPKLAKLPEGVAEISPAELAELVALGPEKGNYFLADARPKKRYEEGSIQGAVSIPVAALKDKQAQLLPENKDKLLIFFCGGPT